jgi:hypothetical protein
VDHKQQLWLQGLAGGWSMRFRPLGGSMAPLSQPGDVFDICPGKNCRVGDVILWQSGDNLFLHRVIAKKNGLVITKGDSLEHPDKPVRQEQILGRAVARERHGRIRRLDRAGLRLLGLAWCLTSWVPGLVPLMAAARRTLRNAARLPGLEAGQPVALQVEARQDVP